VVEDRQEEKSNALFDSDFGASNMPTDETKQVEIASLTTNVASKAASRAESRAASR